MYLVSVDTGMYEVQQETARDRFDNFLDFPDFFAARADKIIQLRRCPHEESIKPLPPFNLLRRDLPFLVVSRNSLMLLLLLLWNNTFKTKNQNDGKKKEKKNILSFALDFLLLPLLLLLLSWKQDNKKNKHKIKNNKTLQKNKTKKAKRSKTTTKHIVETSTTENVDGLGSAGRKHFTIKWHFFPPIFFPPSKPKEVSRKKRKMHRKKPPTIKATG